ISFQVFDPVPPRVIAPLMVVVDKDVNVPVTVIFPERVASAPGFAVHVPGVVTVSAPTTLKGALLAVNDPPEPTVKAADAVKLELQIPVPFTVNAPFVVNGIEEVSFAAPAIVVVKN